MVQLSKFRIRDLFQPAIACVLTPLRIYLFHKSEEIVVATKEDMESHLNMVSTLIHKRTYFATNKWPGFIYVHLEMKPKAFIFHKETKIIELIKENAIKGCKIDYKVASETT